MQSGQGERVPPVGLDPLARTLRDQGGRDHRTAVAERGDLPLQPVAGRAGLVDEGQPPVPLGELADQALDRLGRAVDVPEEAHLALAPRLDRKSTRLNSSHANISYAVFCLKKKIQRPNVHNISFLLPPTSSVTSLLRD